MYSRIICVLFWIAIAFTGKLHGQSKSNSTQLWTDFNYKYYPSSELDFGGQTGLRTDLGSPEWTTFFVVPEVEYRIDEYFEIGAGIGLFKNWNNPGSNSFETRFTQEATANWPQFKRVVFSHRMRFDERYTTYQDEGESSDKKISEWTYRFRYRLRAKSEFFNVGEKVKSLYILGYAEFFIPIEDNSAERFANRTRMVLGFGQLLPKNNRYEIHFMFQQSVNNIEEQAKSDQFILRLRYFLKSLDYQ